MICKHEILNRHMIVLQIRHISLAKGDKRLHIARDKSNKVIEVMKRDTNLRNAHETNGKHNKL